MWVRALFQITAFDDFRHVPILPWRGIAREDLQGLVAGALFVRSCGQCLHELCRVVLEASAEFFRVFLHVLGLLDVRQEQEAYFSRDVVTHGLLEARVLEK